MKKRKLRPSIEITLWVIVGICLFMGTGFLDKAPLTALPFALVALMGIVPIAKWGNNNGH